MTARALWIWLSLLICCDVVSSSADTEPLEQIVGNAEVMEQQIEEILHGRASSSASPSMSELLQQLRFPGAEVCGAPWASQFADTHRKIRARNLPPRYLVYLDQVTAGLGDRINGLVSAFVAALLTRRAFILQNTVANGAFNPSEIEWQLRKRLFAKMKRPIQCSHEEECRSINMTALEGRSILMNFGNGMLREDGSRVNFPTDMLEFFGEFKDISILQIRTNGGVLMKILHSESPTAEALTAMGLDRRTAFGCIVRFLLMPRQHVVDLAALYHRPLEDGAARRPTVCVHLRSSDDFPKLDAEAQGRVFEALRQSQIQCALNISSGIAGRGNLTWLLMSDAVELKRRVKELPWPPWLRVFSTGLKPAPFAESRRAPIVAEWILFSTCTHYIMSNSGFSKTAFAYNLHSPVPYLLPREPGVPRTKPCTSDHPSDPSEFWQWSGL